MAIILSAEDVSQLLRSPLKPDSCGALRVPSASSEALASATVLGGAVKAYRKQVSEALDGGSIPRVDVTPREDAICLVGCHLR